MEKVKRIEDMNYFELLAWLGIGSSHPGGFPATKQNLELLGITSREYVLDAGCGSGLTACHLAKTAGCRIVGIDINPQMIAKARLRAEKEGVSQLVEFKAGDVYQLPFADNCFDLVMAESITVFLDKAKVYHELFRVLKPEGRVADLEMALVRELPPATRKQLEDCYGSGTNPLPFAEWRNVLISAGFQEVDIKYSQGLKNKENLILSELKKDWLLIKGLAEKAASQPSLLPRLQKIAGFMKRNQGYFGYCLLYGKKPALPPRKLSFKERIRQVFTKRFSNHRPMLPKAGSGL